MDRGREPHHRCAYAAVGKRQRGTLARHPRRARRGRIWRVGLDADASGREHQGARGNHQRSIGPGENVTERLDHLAIGARRFVGGVTVAVRQMDHPIGLGCCRTQAVEIGQRPRLDLGAQCHKRDRPTLGSGPIRSPRGQRPEVRRRRPSR